MDNVLLRLLPCISALAAACGFAVLGHSRLIRVASWGAQTATGLLLAYLAWFVLPNAEEGVFDHVGAWAGFGDLFTGVTFALNAATAAALFGVWLACTFALWSAYRGTQGHALGLATLALQALAFASLLFDSLPTIVAAWAVAAVLCDVCEREAGGGPNGIFQLRFVLNRSADVLALFAVLRLFATMPANSFAEFQTMPLAELNAAANTFKIVLLSLCGALAVRTLAVLHTPQTSPRALLQALVVVFCGVHLLWRTSVAVLVPTARPGCYSGVAAAVLIGVLAAWQVRTQGFVWQKLMVPIAWGLRVCAAAMFALSNWIFDGVLLHTPALFVDTCARLLRIVQGSDVQRYVAVGMLGFAGLIYVVSRPAAIPVLAVRSDGLTVKVDAGRGATSAERLQFDYDFDDDGIVDRKASGPQAVYTYATPGNYKLTVTVRDPYWHTQRTLSASVKVGP